MGVPKQKWTAEEEAALKAGVRRHGRGKWQTILRDPEFRNVLISRSNVDLKDKWRNINVTLSGLGSRGKARLAFKWSPEFAKLDGNNSVVNNGDFSEEVAEVNPVVPNETVQVADSKKPYIRLDDVIWEAITTLKEFKGSDKNTISMYIEGQYRTPTNFNFLLNSQLKSLTASGQLLKGKHKYRISRSLPSSETRRSSPPESDLTDCPQKQRKELKNLTTPRVVEDLENMTSIRAQESAAAAARAVAEAEAAIAEAEKAAREAEAAEAEANAAQVFAEAAMRALSCQKLRAC